jgi:malate dehydrogenase (oxaloacetate-decarboxylating)(NADP+)
MIRKTTEALEYHAGGRPGKLEVRATKPTVTQHDLSLAYTPGVAEPCLEIDADPNAAFDYTNKGNLVAVVSNGTAVLGLGNIGALAGKPVMEGKGVLFKRFADVDVFDIEVDSTDADEVIRFCEMLAPTVGGINLEDIKAPECFIIEAELKRRLSIPVFHDDQHGTAIIAGAALLNALELTGRKLADTTIVVSGAGAAGIATSRFFVHLGASKENLVLVDSKGVVGRDRLDGLPPHKAEFATGRDCRTLEEAMEGADVFIGVSIADTVTPVMVKSMAADPIIFAMANPDPEIPYEQAREARPDAIVATGRSDYPNQVNNVLGFPFIFRGALDVRATGITEGMKVAAARALADLAKEPVLDSVLRAYNLETLSFGPEYLIPKPFDPRALVYVASAVAEAAIADGVALRPFDDADEYRSQLQSRFAPFHRILEGMRSRARANPSRIVYPHGDDSRILRAARMVADEGLASPVILGRIDAIEEIAGSEIGMSLEGIEVIDPQTADGTVRDRYRQRLFELRSRKGLTMHDADRALRNPDMYAAMMLEMGDADAVLGGLTTYYPDTLRPALQVLPLEPDRSVVSAAYVLITGGRTFLLADCAVNPNPTAAQMAEIAVATARLARREFDLDPRVALISYSNFGSARGEEPNIVRQAVRLCRELEPDLKVDGEMQADTAVSARLLSDRYPFNQLGKPANVLVFPTLTAANAAYKLLHRLGGAEVVGPILTGLSKSVHVLQRDVDVRDIVNLTAIAVSDSVEKAKQAHG